jgi:uncharacterized protein with HEPN domain
MVNKDLAVLEKINKYCERCMGTVLRCEENFENFLDDYDFYQSISMSLEQIGELSKLLSDEFVKETDNEAHWKLIKDIRNMVAHVYDRMNPKRIWYMAVEDIPKIAALVKRYLPVKE